MSPDLLSHLETGKPLLENQFRYGSDRWAALLREARKAYNEGILTEVTVDDLQVLESDAGELVEYDGKTVILETPSPIHDRRGWFEVFTRVDGAVLCVEFESVTDWDFVTKE